MSDKTYNGWTNYATWRVHLEIFDGFVPYDYFRDANDEFDPSELADNLKEYADEVIFECASISSGFAQDFARAFLSDVNWYEIAKHMISEYADKVQE